MVTSVPAIGVSSVLVVVRPEPPGQHTAEVVGIPELRATAAERGDAVELVRKMVGEWLASGRLVHVAVGLENPLLKYAGWAKDDPLHEEYLEEIRRYRQEVDERECSDSSSTPTT